MKDAQKLTVGLLCFLAVSPWGSTAARAGGGGGVGSCVMTLQVPPKKVTRCTDYVGSMFTPEYGPAACRADVPAYTVTYSKSACPVQERVGTCFMNEGTEKAVAIRHYSQSSAPYAKTGCIAAKGTWKDG